jgi:5-oxoprolinase (ATP-hydrolysing) subunit A
MKIDLNCDMGEGFGAYQLGNDEAVMPFITSANLACGFHAGDPLVMQRTVRLARQLGVSVGAHPGWPDLQGFGRREMHLPAPEAEAAVLYQIGALSAFARAEGIKLRHVKPHGALYNQAGRDRALAGAIAQAVRQFDPSLILVGLAGSALIEAGLAAGLRVAQEGFPDRGYNADGTLMSRSQPNALLEQPRAVAEHAVALAVEGIDFNGRHVQVDTLCLHGDHARAAENARLVRAALTAQGVEVTAM